MLHINYNMYFKLIMIYPLFINIYATPYNKFIVDYFYYKKVLSIVGFSCNIIEDDLSLFKHFNNRGILASLSKLNTETQISVIAHTEQTKLGIFLDSRCYDLEIVTSIFLEASEYRMFDDLHLWLILTSDLEIILSRLDDRTFSISTELVIAVVSDFEDVQLYDVYNSVKERGSVLNVTFISNWNEKSGLNITLKQDKLARRSNLHRIILKVIFFEVTYKPAYMPLEEYLDDFSTATKDARSKFGFQILKHLGDMYNFSLVASESSKWEENDTLGPLARAIANSEGDFGGSLLTLNIERSYILKFVHQDWPFRTCLIFRNPQPTNIAIKTIFVPFETRIWYLIIIFVIIFVISLCVVLIFEKNNKNTIYSNSILITIGTLSQQATNMKMKFTSTRLVFLFTMIFSIIIYNYYSAHIVSARISQPIFKINDSLNEFSKLNLKLSSEQIVYLQFAFNDPNWQVQKFYHNIWKKIPQAHKYIPPEEGIPLVQKGGFAYHTHPDVSYPLIESLFNYREICELMEVHLIRRTLTAFPMPYNSSLTELSKIGLTKIAEVGLTNRQLIRWQYRKPKCRKDLLSASSITIYEFSPFLILLGSGMLLSITICIIEIFVYNNSHNKHKNNLKIKSMY